MSFAVCFSGNSPGTENGLSARRRRQLYDGHGAGPIRAIVQVDAALHGLDDLSRQHHADAGPLRLGREKWHEQVVAGGEPMAPIGDLDANPFLAQMPAHHDAVAACLVGIAQQIDQHLLELIAVRPNAGVGAGPDTYTSLNAVERQSRDISDRLQQIPGVASVAASTNLPTGSRLNLPITLPDDQQIHVPFRPVTSQYLKTFDIPVIAGRGLEEHDSAGAENVCIVSAAFAEQYLDDKALDKVIRGPGGGTMRIVGVAGNVRQDGPA